MGLWDITNINIFLVQPKRKGNHICFTLFIAKRKIKTCERCHYRHQMFQGSLKGETAVVMQIPGIVLDHRELEERERRLHSPPSQG